MGSRATALGFERAAAEQLSTQGSETARYERMLASDPRWALSEASKFFEGGGAVQESLDRIARRLNELGISYAVIGGLALFRHGYRRFTEDIDLLVTRQGLAEIHQKLEGHGYLPPFTGSKHLRDTQSKVKIEFLVTGDYPGDGKEKPVAFPDPSAVSVVHEEIRYLNLHALIELKLASGISNAGRLRDISDVLELIKALGLSQEIVSGLNPYVHEKYLELWELAQRADAEADG
jgi:hypothetical protein